MNYNEKCEELKNNQLLDWFKAESGTYKIVILEEPVEKLKTFNKGRDDEETKFMISMRIETNGKQFTWEVGKAMGYASIYGQLMLLGRAKGKLAGEVITLIVKRANNKNDYTVMECVDLLPKKQ